MVITLNEYDRDLIDFTIPLEFLINKELVDALLSDIPHNIMYNKNGNLSIQLLNENFTYQDKLDFVFCIFEVAHIDNELHFKEQHLIKQISNILNIENHDLIKIKIEIEKYL